MTGGGAGGEAGSLARVADVIGATVARAGAQTAFVFVSGEAETPLLDAMARGGLRVVQAGRGAGACVMAAVAGWLTDAPGVAVLALDDSESQVLAALGQAWRDRAPLVVVTDRAFDLPWEGVVKASLVLRAETAAHWSAHACQLALTEPRGPVHLVVPPATAAARAVPLATSVRPGRRAGPDPVVLDGAADLLAQAQRPILIAGQQCRTLEVATWVRALAEALPAPVVVTAHGKGAFPDPHPLNLGVIGAGTSPEAILRRADLAVSIGLDAAELPLGALPAALPVLHLAASPWARTELPPRLEVVGDIALLIEELAPRLRGRARADWDVAELDRLKRAIGVPRGEPGSPGHLPIAAVVRIVREATPAGTIAIAASDGDTDAIVALWQVVAPGELLVPAPPCLRAFALPAAWAAAIARPGTRVVCFVGARQVLLEEDELDVVGRLALPVVVLLVGDAGEATAETLGRLAAGRGWTVARARDAVSLGVGIERALAGGRPALLDVRG